MKMVRPAYECPRCSYSTRHKTNMKNHFYKLKSSCPAVTSDMELTDEIKEHVLNNRVYRPQTPVQHEPSTSTIIHQYNTINNFIAGMDAVEKLTKYMQYSQKTLIGFEQSIDDQFSRKVKRLEMDGYKYGFQLNSQDLLDVIDDISNKHCTVLSYRQTSAAAVTSCYTA